MRPLFAAALAALSPAAAAGSGNLDTAAVVSLLQGMKEDIKNDVKKEMKDEFEAQMIEMQHAFEKKLVATVQDAHTKWRLPLLKLGNSDAYLLGAPPAPMPSCPGFNATNGFHIVDKAWQSIILPTGKQFADCCTECDLLECVALEFIAANTTCNLYKEAPNKFASSPGALTAFKGPLPTPAAYDKIPIGAVFAWWRPSAAVPLPAGFEPCDGTKVTTNFSPYYGFPKPDLRNRFVLGAEDPSAIGAVGGSATTSGTAVTTTTPTPLAAKPQGAHQHGIPQNTDPAFHYCPTPACANPLTTGGVTGSAGVHGHDIAPHTHNATVTVTVPVDPPYVGLLMLMRVV